MIGRIQISVFRSTKSTLSYFGAMQQVLAIQLDFENGYFWTDCNYVLSRDVSI
jgi:hypothetical protein